MQGCSLAALRRAAIVWAASAAFGAFCFAAELTHANDWRVVAKAGQIWQVPQGSNGTPAEASLTRFEYSSLNNHGEVAFAAFTSRGPAAFSEPRGELAFAATFQPAPGLPPGTSFSGQSFTSFGALPGTQNLFRLDDAGRTLFAGRVNWPSPSNQVDAVGYWTEQAGQVSLIAAEGTPAPLEYSGAYFYKLGRSWSEPSYYSRVTPSPSGGEYFGVVSTLNLIGSTSGFGSGTALWVMGPSGLRLIAQVPSTSSSSPVFPSSAVTSGGDIAYSTVNRELFFDRAGTLTQVAGPLTAVPGAPAGSTFLSFLDLKTNDANALGFVASITGRNVGTNDSRLFQYEGEALRSVVSEGDPVPDVPESSPGVPGAVFRNITTSAPPFKLWSVGRDGGMLFQAKIGGPAIAGAFIDTLWTEHGGTLQRLLSGGDSMPGLPEGYRLSAAAVDVFTNVLMNEQGTLAVEALFANASGYNVGSGVWARRAGDEAFTPIAFVSGALDLPGGLSAPVTSIKLKELNERGQILLQANVGGDALLVSNAVAMLADFNEDTLVDGDDLAAWEQAFGSSDAVHSDGDANGDGVVDGADFLRWQREVRPTAAPDAATVPEPGSVALTMSALIAVMGVRRRAGYARTVSASLLVLLTPISSRVQNPAMLR